MPESVHPLQKYSVLYVDPPWEYENKHTGGNLKRSAKARARGDDDMAEKWRSGASGADQQYPTLSLDDMMALPMSDICHDDAVLAMWACVPHGDDPYRLMRAWGFEFKTSYFWIKTGRMGMGHYFRGDVEILHFATRGDVRPFRMSKERNYKMLPQGEHSQKPHFFRQLVERATHAVAPGPRVEIFARERFEGWLPIGLDIDGTDIRTWLSDPAAAVAMQVPHTSFESESLFS